MLQSRTNPIDTIARLNDRARLGLDRTCKIMMTSNLLAQLSDGSPTGRVIAQAKAMKAARICTFQADTPERDFASFEIDGVKAFLKVDYYDVNLQFGSEDPADASVTRRVVTIMAAEDY